MTDQEIVAALVATKRWSSTEAERGLREKFKCAYCDRDLLESPEAYREWQVDHIVPRHAGGLADPSNEVLACRTCNVNWKVRWNPRDVVGPDGTREQLIEACRKRVADVRARVLTELEADRSTVSWRGKGS